MLAGPLDAVVRCRGRRAHQPGAGRARRWPTADLDDRRRAGGRRHRGDGRRAARARARHRARRRPRRSTVAGRGRATAPGSTARLDVRLSGTTARFVAPVLALGDGAYHLDGQGAMRERPMGPTIVALRSLGAEVDRGRRARSPAARDRSGVGGLASHVVGAGDVSSQFASGLLLAAPVRPDGLHLTLDGDVVSAPYLDLTVAVMRAFGAEVDRPDERTVRGRAPAAIEPPDLPGRARRLVRVVLLRRGRHRRRPGAGRRPRRRLAPGRSRLRRRAGPHGRRGRRSADDAHRGDAAPGRSPASTSTSPTCPTWPRRWPSWPRSPTDRRRVARRSGSSAGKESDRIAAVVTRAAPVRHRRRRDRRRLRRAPGPAPAGGGADLRRPPDGDELRAGRPARPRGRDRRSRVRRQDVPRLLGRARRAVGGGRPAIRVRARWPRATRLHRCA